MSLQREYQFEFSVQQYEGSKAVIPYHKFKVFIFCMNFINLNRLFYCLARPITKNRRHDKISNRQQIRGHLIKLKQFNHPVYCVLCQRFI
jgi:hypothetical protein